MGFNLSDPFQDVFAQIVSGLGIMMDAAVFESLMFWSKIISALISALLLGGIVMVVLKMYVRMQQTMRDLTEVLRETRLPRQRLQDRWRRIRRRIESGVEAEYKLAVIEADKMMDMILEHLGYRGKTLPERLKQLKPNELKTLDGLFAAHRIRNAIVQDPRRHITDLEAQEALANYEAALRELDIID